MEQLLLVVLPLVFVFFLPSASPQAENLGGDGVEGRFLQFTIEEGGQLGGGYEAKSEGKQDMGLFVGSDVIRGKGRHQLKKKIRFLSGIARIT